MHIISAQLFTDLSARAAASARLRANHNLHSSLADPTQRLLNAMEPGTYVRPHHHLDPPRWEVFLCLRGGAVVLTFEDDGTVSERVEIEEGGSSVAVELEARPWHSLVPTEPGSVFLELKPGPYTPLDEHDFAPWAPQENDPRVGAFISWMEHAMPGARTADTFQGVIRT